MNRSATAAGPRTQRGQAITILVFGLIAMLMMTALIIDGGNAWAQQRITQNASDAAALAGATVMVENLGGAAKTDADVNSAVQGAAASNETTIDSAVYVDWSGSVVGTVGQGGAIPGTAAGVKAVGTKNVTTYLANLAGITDLDTRAEATAVAGTLTGICAAESGCGLMPVTFSVNITDCAGNGNIQIGSSPWPLTSIETARADKGVGTYEATVPLCKVGPGGVGWLDFGCGNLANHISNPCNVSFDIPTWIQTSTGNPNNVEDEFNAYIDQIILIPLFDGTCRNVPASGLLPDCTDPGNGDNLYYHIPKFTAFLLDRAYIQGNNGPACNSAPGQPAGGNGGTSCLKGWFIRYVTQGPVGPFDPTQDQGSALGVQLIH